MAGLEFDRQAFTAANPPPSNSATQLLRPLALVLGIALIAFVGYKVFLVNTQNNALASANTQVQQLQEQLAEMQKRVDFLERHHKPAQTQPATALGAPDAKTTAATVHHPRTVYHIAAASSLPPQTKSPVSTQTPAGTTKGTSGPDLAGLTGAVAENHDAWQATTDRLADVVGVVGTQQAELSATRDAVNQILAQSHRRAVSFEVNRHSSPVPVGPVTLQFKSSDSKRQHYTVCVFFSAQSCIELRDRALNEVVVFVVTKNQPPLELVATKINRDQVAGYLEVPTSMQ